MLCFKSESSKLKFEVQSPLRTKTGSFFQIQAAPFLQILNENFRQVTLEYLNLTSERVSLGTSDIKTGFALGTSGVLRLGTTE